MQPIVTWSVGLSVSVTLVSPAKTAEPIEMPFGLRTWVMDKGTICLLDGSPDPHGKGKLQGVKGRPVVAYHNDSLP